MSRRTTLALMAVCAMALLPAPTAGQGQIPRAADGKPDLSGVWQAATTANWNLLPHAAEKDVPAGLGVVEGNEIPYQPWAAAQQRENFANRAKADPESQCFLPGVPRIMYMPFPFQIFQTPGHVAMAFEYVHAVRRVFMNTPHPAGPIEWWMGDSRGRWEGDTLVVDVVHFTNQTWFDRTGNFHSEGLHVIERYTPIGPHHIQYEATIEDPKVFTRPWKISFPLYRRLEKGIRVLDYECYAFGLERTWYKPSE
jgi:hypothetical protein